MIINAQYSISLNKKQIFIIIVNEKDDDYYF